MPTITLTQDNFDSVVTSFPIALVDWWAGPGSRRPLPDAGGRDCDRAGR